MIKIANYKLIERKNACGEWQRLALIDGALYDLSNGPLVYMSALPHPWVKPMRVPITIRPASAEFASSGERT